jgi:cytoskeletal protein CcmA (bactofilin family)
MSIFGRKKDDSPEGTAAEATATPAAREGELGVPTFRAPPANSAPVGLPPKPGLPATGTPPLRAPAAGSRPNRPEPGAERRTLVVGKGISLQGTVSDAERLVVEGTVESQMIQAAELSVGPTGVFRGEVQVEDAEIAGLFDGTLTVRGSLLIRGTGKVKGTAKYRRLSVEEGGSVMGSMEMLPGEG